MKNLKVYDKLNKKNKSNKRRLKLTSLLTGVALLAGNMSGCLAKEKANASKDNTNDDLIIIDDNDNFYKYSSNNSSESETEVYKEESLNKDEQDFLNLSVVFDNTTEVDQIIDSIETEYVFSDIYDVAGAYEKYKSMKIYDGEPTDSLLIGTKFDSEKLFERVKKNNTTYLNQSGYSQYDTLDDETIKHFCDIIVKTLNTELENNKFETTYDDLTANLNDLKIFKSIYLDNAYITEDNILGVSTVAMENMKFVAQNENADDIVIAHETEHLLQKLCTKTINNQNVEYAYGYNVKFKDLPVNSIYHNWLIEASAENLACAIFDSEPTTYKYKIGYLNSLTFTRILKDDFNVYDVERLTQQQDINKVFKVFDCETEEEKIEFLNMMESINIIEDEPEDFMNLYKQKILNKSVDDDITDSEIESLKVGLKNGVCTTLSKYFYKSLSDKLLNNEMNIKDIYMLISLFEADLSGHISYSASGNYSQRSNFMQNYVKIQDEFFNKVAQSLNSTEEIVEQNYQKFNNSIESSKITFLDEKPTVNIEVLNDNKNKFITKYFYSIIGNKNISIDETVNKYAKK